MTASEDPAGEASPPEAVASPTDAEDLPDHPEGPQVSNRRRWIGWSIAAVGLLLVLVTAWVGWRTYQAYRHLNAAADQVSALQAQVKSINDVDLGQARAAVDRMRQEADGAVSATSDPLYRLVGHLPWVGPNLQAIGAVAETVDSLATTTAPELIDVATSVQPAALAPKNGTIAVAPISAAAARLQTADAAVSAAWQRMAGIARSQLVGPVANAVNVLQNKLLTLSATTSTAARIGRLAPPLLGATGARRYLVLFQNLAEPRATGGIFGSYAVLEVDQGKLRITDQGSSSRDIGTFKPPLPLPADLSPALYGDLPGRFPTDANLTPDFPTAASLFAQMYTARKHLAVDGVLAIDPVALSYLLQGAAPIDVGHGISITAKNITRVLLSEAYALYPDSSDVPARDAFLADATAKAFTAITSAPANASAEIHGLTKAVDERRLLLWSAHPSEQTDLAATGVAGILPTTDGATPVIGVFRNDGTGAKLGFYAGGHAQVTAGSCTGQRRRLTLTLDLTSSAPASGLPPYVLGLAEAGSYVLRTNVMVFAPISSEFSSLTVDGKQVPVIWATENGRKVGMVTVDLKPGAAATVVGQLDVSAPAATASKFAPRIVMTPGVSTWKTTAADYGPCS